MYKEVQGLSDVVTFQWKSTIDLFSKQPDIVQQHFLFVVVFCLVETIEQSYAYGNFLWLMC